MAFQSDIALTEKRRERLAKYLGSHVLDEQEKFVCIHCNECKSSHCGRGSFSEGQLPHLGRHYDIEENKVPLRVVVVGQEYGADRSKISLDVQYKEMLECGHDKRFTKTAGHRVRNPHMRGTTSVLRLLFGGNLGTGHKSEFLHFIDQTSCHLFDAFALVNYLLCAAHASGSTALGNSTRIMKQNCGSHFRQVLEILEPTVIVVQGKGIWKWVCKCFDDIKPIEGVLYRGQIGKAQPLVASFTHPSARSKYYNWGTNEKTPYLKETVLPTVHRIRQLLFEEHGAVI